MEQGITFIITIIVVVLLGSGLIYSDKLINAYLGHKLNKIKTELQNKYPDIYDQILEYYRIISWENRTDTKIWHKLLDRISDLRKLIPDRTSKELVEVEREIDYLESIKPDIYDDYKQELYRIDSLRKNIIENIKNNTSKKDLKKFTKIFYDEELLK